jgi:hypothetical protein
MLGAYAFWYAALGKASAEAAVLAENVRSKSQESEKIAAAKVALETLAEDEASIRAYLVREEEIVPFLGRLEETGAGLGASVDVVSVSTETLAERNRIMLSVKIEGTFDAVLRTLGSIEYGPYDSSVERVTFDTVPSGETPSGEWTATVIFALGTQSTPAP